MSELHPESVVVSAGRPHAEGAPVNSPIVMTAPYRHSSADDHYSRHDPTETIRAFEELLGALEGGQALAFSSGMGAISAVVDSLPVGTIVVVPDGQYSGTVSTFDEAESLGRLIVRRVDVADTPAVIAALPGSGLLCLEAVTNPLMSVPDIPALSSAAHEAGALVGVDATFCSPINLRPLEFGVD